MDRPDYAQLVATHKNCDFDALASMAAATLVYPGAVGLLPSKLRPNVKEYLAIHAGLFRIRPRTMIDLNPVARLIAVDACRWMRLDGVDELSKRNDLAVHVWDHHSEESDLAAEFVSQERIGAAVTLLVEEIARLDLPFSPMQATLFLMGIYEDTGNLTYVSTTPRDVRMAAFLLENGADLNVLASYLSDSLDDEHVEFLGRMLGETEIQEIAGLKMLFAMQTATNRMNLAPLVNKARKIKGADAAFGIFLNEEGNCMLIGRDASDLLDIGAITREFGGGGHPGAGSAIVRGVAPEQLKTLLIGKIVQSACRQDQVEKIMSLPDKYVISRDADMAEAMERIGQTSGRVLLVTDENRVLGMIGVAECAKVRSDSQRRAKVTSFMRVKFAVISPGQNAAQALRLMTESGAEALPVIENGILVGLVTRGDAVLHIY